MIARACVGLAVAACGATAAPPPVPSTSPVGKEVADQPEPVDPRAAKICEAFAVAVERCPDLDTGEPFSRCARTYGAALSIPSLRAVAEARGRCVLDGGMCAAIEACLDQNPPDFYAVTSYNVGPACAPELPRSTRSLVFEQAPPLAAFAAHRGKRMLVTFSARWESAHEHLMGLLGKLAARDPETAVVVVLSNTESEVAAVRASGLHLIADPPVGDETLGPLTRAWHVFALPESFLVGRAGRVRHHFVAMHDWASASAAACVRTVR